MLKRYVQPGHSSQQQQEEDGENQLRVGRPEECRAAKLAECWWPKSIEMGGDRELGGVQEEADLPMLTEAQGWEVPTQQ